MAPWVHTHFDPEGRRALCCVSPGQASSQSFEEYWNGPYLKNVRQKMIRGESLSDCAVCDAEATPGRQFYNEFYAAHKESVLSRTSQDGAFTGLPISIDYRLGNLCNFKCLMCGSGASTSWAAERKHHPDGYTRFIQTLIMDAANSTREQQSRELMLFVESGSMVDILWGGGEPLINPVHWKAMNRLIETGQAERVYVRYNTNLSKITFKGQDLPSLLRHFPKFYLGASMDACAETGEYLRHGLNWKQFVENLLTMKSVCDDVDRKIHLEHRLTLPGILDLANVAQFANQHQIAILSKLVISDLSPREMPLVDPKSLPRRLVDPLLHKALKAVETANTNGFADSLVDSVNQLLHSPRAEDLLSPQDYQSALVNAAREIEISDQFRYKKARFKGFFESQPEVYDFIEGISRSASARPLRDDWRPLRP